MKILIGICFGLALCFCAIGLETGNIKVLLSAAFFSIATWCLTIDDIGEQ